MVELHTTNGGVRLRSRDSINTRTDTDSAEDWKDLKDTKKAEKDEKPKDR
jgi:hypothetical protein